MRISSKVECGIIALIDIAVNARGNNIVKLNAISKRNNISAKYLEQIVPLLKHGNFLKSVKGSGGGYALSRDPSEISVNEIVNALDNTILSVTTFNDKLVSDASTAINDCLWIPINDYLCSFSEKLTLKALADRYNELNNTSSAFMYYI